MKKYILFIILSFFNSNMFADTNIFGYWLTSGSIVKIENCNNQVCGKIVTVFVEGDIDPKSVLDKNNKNKSLRERTLVGIDLLSEFQINNEDQKNFIGGEKYMTQEAEEHITQIYILNLVGI